jgi:hypothetical protein
VASAAATSIPSRSAARQTSNGSPTGSAAATSSKSRAAAGIACNSVLKALLEPSRQRLPRGVQQTETTGKLLDRQPTGQLQEREGIASRLGDDAIADPLVEPET